MNTTQSLDFPGRPVVKNLPSTAGDMGLIPDQGTKILHSAGQQEKTTGHNEDLAQPKFKNNNKKIKNNLKTNTALPLRNYQSNLGERCDNKIPPNIHGSYSFLEVGWS